MKKTRDFKNIFKTLFRNVIVYLFPPQCPYCEKIIDSEQILCDECFHKIHFIHAPKCYWCSVPLPIETDTGEKMLCAKCLSKRPLYDMARSAFVYDIFSRQLILKFKYYDRTDLRHILVHYLLKAGIDLFDKTDLVIPVPMYWLRRLKRQYNQSAVLAELLARKIHKEYNGSVLYRTHHTESQTHKTAKERKQNLTDAFQVRNAELIQGKRILLIDDVLTTGATAESCAKVLKKNGAKAVYVLTMARSVKK